MKYNAGHVCICNIIIYSMPTEQELQDTQDSEHSVEWDI